MSGDGAQGAGVAGGADGSSRARAARVLVDDRFEGEVARGRAIGTRASDGSDRHVTDAEGAIGADHGALRIATPARPGWGRTGIAYGPVAREPGLVLGVFMLNGHNTSQSYSLESVVRQVGRWMLGGGTNSLLAQGAGYLRHPAREGVARRLACWWASRAGATRGRAPVTENLAVGLFTSANPADPLGEGHALVMHAASHECGELWATTSRGPVIAFTGFQNVPACFVIVARARGAACYVAGMPGARGVGAWPMMRPVAIDDGGDATSLYPGVHQAALGEIGFSVDTRVYAVRAGVEPALAPWWGTAHVAMTRDPGGVGDRVDAGPAWRREGGLAWAAARVPTGLIHARMVTTPTGDGHAIVFRVEDGANHWALRLAPDRCVLARVQRGAAEVLGSDGVAWRAGSSVQILDDGRGIAVHVDGRRLFAGPVINEADGGALGVGVESPTGGAIVERFEAHPREVPMPGILGFARPWDPGPTGGVAEDDFAGAIGDLAGRVASGATGPWERTLGRGVIECAGVGARVRASATDRCPGRTLYTIPWTIPAFAELAIDMTPPGTGRYQRHEGRGGVVFWQDPRNFLIVNLWLHDGYEGASISSFLVIDGFDDVYNAVWTNIGSRATWGRRMALRAGFDGERYLVRVGDEPVLYRAVADVYPRAPRWRITRVGIAANWEWGTDSGTTFHRFEARAPA